MYSMFIKVNNLHDKKSGNNCTIKNQKSLKFSFVLYEIFYDS